MRVLFKSRARLGDALLCFPSALHLHRQGHEVTIECPDRWHPIFRWISYARPCPVGKGAGDWVFDTNLLNMVHCRGTVINYIQEAYPELAGVPRNQRALFDLPHRPAMPSLPFPYAVVAPFGYSQHFTVNPEWMITKARALVGPHIPVLCLSDVPRPALSAPTLLADSVDQLPVILRDAVEVLTINSAPNIIAASVGRHYYLVPNRDPIDGRTNYYVPGQTILAYP